MQSMILTESENFIQGLEWVGNNPVCFIIEKGTGKKHFLDPEHIVNGGFKIWQAIFATVIMNKQLGNRVFTEEEAMLLLSYFALCLFNIGLNFGDAE